MLLSTTTTTFFLIFPSSYIKKDSAFNKDRKLTEELVETGSNLLSITLLFTEKLAQSTLTFISEEDIAAVRLT